MTDSIAILTLLNLTTGTLIRATLQSGREVTVRITRRPYLVASGKPGINRVRIEATDDTVKISDTAIFPTKGRHTVHGHRVLSILA